MARLRARQAHGNATLASALDHVEECRLHERLHSLADGAEELIAVKARRRQGARSAAPLGDNAERIVRVRLDELTSFMPKATDPAEVVALHDMRIAAKRLRYILEVTGSCFGPYASGSVRMVKDLQDLLGEIHDCDVQLPEVAAFLEELVAEDVGAAGASPKDLAKAPNRRTYAGPRRPPGAPEGAPQRAVRAVPGALARLRT